MGIDTFASRSSEDIILTEEDKSVFQEANIQLCGGMFSGDGSDGSFRGKVYALLIIEITGQSLTQEWIPPEKVCEMYESMKNSDINSDLDTDYKGDEDLVAIKELLKFFKVCCERGLGLINWG